MNKYTYGYLACIAFDFFLLGMVRSHPAPHDQIALYTLVSLVFALWLGYKTVSSIR